MSNAASPANLLRGRLFNYDCLIRQGIKDGSIMVAMEEEMDGMVSVKFISHMFSSECGLFRLRRSQIRPALIRASEPYSSSSQ
jgi:hypothetical protein